MLNCSPNRNDSAGSGPLFVHIVWVCVCVSMFLCRRKRFGLGTIFFFPDGRGESLKSCLFEDIDGFMEKETFKVKVNQSAKPDNKILETFSLMAVKCYGVIISLLRWGLKMGFLAKLYTLSMQPLRPAQPSVLTISPDF